jgi:UDP-glucose 4-epimerase
VSRTVLITGANGFVGRHIALRCSREGYKVIGIGHGVWNGNGQHSFGIDEWSSADVTIDNLAVASRNYKIDTIIHCAGGGLVSSSLENPYKDFINAVVTTAAVLEFTRKYTPQTKVIFISSAAVYGSAQSLPINESAKLNPASPYGVHKLMAEQLCSSYALNFNISTIVLRLFSVYGDGNKKQLLWDACNKLSRNECTFSGSGNELRDWIHVSDVAELILILIASTVTDAPICKVLNGGTGIGSSVGQVLDLASQFFGVKDKIRFSGLVRPGDPIGLEADISNLKTYDWNPRITLSSGVEQYIQWYKKNHHD